MQKLKLSGSQIQNSRFPIDRVLDKPLMPFTSAFSVWFFFCSVCLGGRGDSCFVVVILVFLTLKIAGLEEDTALELPCELST